MNESDDLSVLLQFFLSPIEKQDELLPEKFDPVWVRFDHFDRAANTPRLLLALILRHLIGNEIAGSIRQGTYNSSSDALRLLLEMLFEIDEGTLFVRLRPEEGIVGYVLTCWELVGVLCQEIANTLPAPVSPSPSFEFDYFREKYHDPMGQEAARLAYPVEER